MGVVYGLTLSCLVVLLLPLDVANREGDGGLDMTLLYEIMYLMIAVMAIVLVPFMIFHYEAYDPESRELQCWTALKYQFVTVVVAAVTISMMWLFLGYADVPITEYSYNISLLPPDDWCDRDRCPDDGDDTYFRVSVTPVVYVMALTSFVGWFLFVVFGAVGLAALPIDMLRAYQDRPQSIDLQEYAKQKMLLNERTAKLIEIGEQLGPKAHRARARKQMTQYNQFKQAVYFLERDWERVKIAYKERGGNPLRHMACFVLGCIFAILSIVWILHIILYLFIEPAPTLFLNAYFMTLDGVFPLFGVITYGIFVFYLLFCVTKGCIKVGLRFFCIQIHPLRVGNTLMNSLLVNVLLLLLCSISIVQFAAQAFASYARLTAADLLFGIQVRNMIFFRYFFRNDVFLYIFVIIAGISAVWLGVTKDKRALADVEMSV